jgi:RNA recognition motif-containing protein
MGAKIYVGNMSYDTSEDELREAFAAGGGEVVSVSIPTDRETGRPRGFAFVEMGSAEAAAKAIQAMDGQMLGGRTLKVREAEDRRGGGGGGGGRGGGGYGGGGGGRGGGRGGRGGGGGGGDRW